ncbi:MAG: hypothetical protein MZW92_58225 [Comamonadaceae bacterium]|nr:hypothetical protein [Comamonadaceae bacterium]
MNRNAATVLGIPLLAGLLASPLHAEDLLQIYQEALGYDAQYAAAKAQLDAGRERMPQARAGLLPNVSRLRPTPPATTSRPAAGADSPATAQTFNTNGYQVQLSQPLFRWQNWVQYDQSEAPGRPRPRLQFASMPRRISILRVAQAYFDVLLAQDNLNVARRPEDGDLGSSWSRPRSNFEVGTATITDTHEAQSRYDLAVAQEIAAAERPGGQAAGAARRSSASEPEALKTLRATVQIQRPQPDDMQPVGRVRRTEQLQRCRSSRRRPRSRQREVDRNARRALPDGGCRGHLWLQRAAPDRQGLAGTVDSATT